MQDIFKALIIALVQGITEWLPVSSSGHIALAENLLNYPQSLEFEVALHFGTLMAVFVYFGKDITDIIKEVLRLNFKSENGKLSIYLLIATIPAVIIGFFLEKISYSIFSNLTLTSLGFAVTGILLIITSLSKKQNRKLNNKKSLIIGLAQVFALFPGVSRSGATISTGILSGLNEKNAAKFSF